MIPPYAGAAELAANYAPPGGGPPPTPNHLVQDDGVSAVLQDDGASLILV